MIISENNMMFCSVVFFCFFFFGGWGVSLLCEAEPLTVRHCLPGVATLLLADRQAD